MPHIQVDDLDMYYEQRGSGPHLLMIMGFCANIDWWPDGFQEILAERFTLTLFDNRCAGRTRGDMRRFSIKQAARDALGLMDALGIQRTHLLGISMGGMIAQELTLLAPERVQRLVLGCTGPGPLRGAILSRSGLRVMTRHLFNKGYRRRTFLVNLMFVDLSRPRRREFLRRVAIAPISQRGRLYQFRGIVGFNSLKRLGGLDHATLIITGTRDALLPARNSRIMARRIPNATLIELDGKGHAFIGEDEDISAGTIRDFLLGEPIENIHAHGSPSRERSTE